ncbi:efflux RND transporter periplasmic adaptor subunit [Pseudomonas syringae pv. dysoxyli]|nr:efflux RND transporter periplasmic adaptor subunit [Pseudomonas syringae pv. dysoxyli]
MSRKNIFLYAALTTGIAISAVTAFNHSAIIGINTAQASDEKLNHSFTEVDVAQPMLSKITEYQKFSGKMEAVDSVEIRPQVAGAITAVHFKDGASVKKGDALFTIDPRLYQAAVDMAEGDLASARARASYAQTDAARAARLLPQKAISQRDHDAAIQLARTANAQLKSAEAQVQTARVNLGYCHIAAPVSGRVSRAELTLGNVVSSGAAAPVLTKIVSISPIYASFEVDEQSYLRYLAPSQSQSATVDLGLSNESGFPRHGRIDSVDNQLDGKSGTIRVRARFENPEGSLVPGMYASLKVSGGEARNVLLINDAAVGTDQSRKFVMTVDEKQITHYREVELGRLYHGMRIVEKGLLPTDQVIVSGGQRVRSEEQVQITIVPMEQKAVALSSRS